MNGLTSLELNMVNKLRRAFEVKRAIMKALIALCILRSFHSDEQLLITQTHNKIQINISMIKTLISSIAESFAFVSHQSNG
jgi:hypothetical protein